MPDTETLDRLYLEWSQFTQAKTWRDIAAEKALTEIAHSMSRKWAEPGEHANWCIERAQAALAEILQPLTAGHGQNDNR